MRDIIYESVLIQNVQRTRSGWRALRFVGQRALRDHSQHNREEAAETLSRHEAAHVEWRVDARQAEEGALHCTRAGGHHAKFASYRRV